MLIHRCHLFGSFWIASQNHSLGMLQYHSCTAACAVSLSRLKLHAQLNTVLHAGGLSVPSPHQLQIADMWRFNAFIPQEPHGPSLPMIITFHFATLVQVLRQLDLVMLYQILTGMQNYSHLVKECCTMTTLSTDNLHALTACYLPQQQCLFKSFSSQGLHNVLCSGNNVCPEFKWSWLSGLYRWIKSQMWKILES
jgi:hypothetical protein